MFSKLRNNVIKQRIAESMDKLFLGTINIRKMMQKTHFPPNTTLYAHKHTQSIIRIHAATSNRTIATASPERLVLGIESSCDDTGVAIVSSSGRILGESLKSQVDIHSSWGGVVPKLAQEAHEAAIDSCVQQALDQAEISPQDLDAIAVTIGPGLSLCLRVGVMKARSVSAMYNIPLIPVHHMEAHAMVARLPSLYNNTLLAPTMSSAIDATSSSSTTDATKDSNHTCNASPSNPPSLLSFPFVCLLVSGGHNLLLIVEGVGRYIQLGSTLDDALGEAYDKVARLLGLELKPSGGAALEKLASGGDAHKYKFSLPLLRKKTCDFSYAGLKTSVRLTIEKILSEKEQEGNAGGEVEQWRADVAASFQRVAVQHLMDRCKRGIQWAKETHPEIKHIVVAGGVASNRYIRSELQAVAEGQGVELVCPPPRFCTDNGVMVAWAGQERLELGVGIESPAESGELGEGEWLDLRPRWPLTDRKDERSIVATRSAKKKNVFTSLEQLTGGANF